MAPWVVSGCVWEGGGRGEGKKYLVAHGAVEGAGRFAGAGGWRAVGEIVYAGWDMRWETRQGPAELEGSYDSGTTVYCRRERHGRLEVQRRTRVIEADANAKVGRQGKVAGKGVPFQPYAKRHTGKVR